MTYELLRLPHTRALKKCQHFFQNLKELHTYELCSKDEVNVMEKNEIATEVIQDEEWRPVAVVEPLSVVFPGTESNRFWFDDGSVILRVCTETYSAADPLLIYDQVQETFYKMHRSLLEAHSKVLREKFLVGSPTQKRPDLYPIALEGFESHDFERFLTLIYPL